MVGWLALVLLWSPSGECKTTIQGQSRAASRESFAPSNSEQKVNLVLDQLEYRSSSQGPIMPKELEPTSKDDFEAIDSVIERACQTHGWDPVIPQYKKSMQWAWQQWEFTIAQRLWLPACCNMLVPLFLVVFTHLKHPGTPWWSLPKDHRLYGPFIAMSNGWNYLLTFATFVTTFFVGHSHDFWRKSYGLTRSVQGRVNDIGFVCAIHACRRDGALTAEAAQFLDDTSRNLRLMHCLVCRTDSSSARAGAWVIHPR